MSDRKTWFITGCDSGMGYAVAETVLADGDTVVVTALDETNIAPLIEQYRDTAHGYTLDVTNTDRIRTVVADAESVTGGIDVLFNNAGYGLLAAAEETQPDEYRPLFEVNFFGMAEVTRALLPYMRKRRSGHILNTSSAGGYAASPGFAFYAASKFAVEGFSDALSQEVVAFGIKLTIVEPGSFRTNFAGSAMIRPKQPIDDYKNTAVSLTTTRMDARDGAQPNDPRKLARVLAKIVRDPEPPQRLPLGQDSIERLEKKVAAVAAEFEKWKPVSLSVAFDATDATT